jgi:hypothetical protein
MMIGANNAARSLYSEECQQLKERFLGCSELLQNIRTCLRPRGELLDISLGRKKIKICPELTLTLTHTMPLLHSHLASRVRECERG